MTAMGCRSSASFGKLLSGKMPEYNGWTLAEYDKLF
jgi:hypothetical protein